MKLTVALQNVTRLFLDSAPVIYYIEKQPQYLSITKAIFTRIDSGSLQAVASAITLAESLVVPYRAGSVSAQQAFVRRVTRGLNTDFVVVDQPCAEYAAQLAVYYNLKLFDSIQIAAALLSNCDSFLTNDAKLRRITHLRVLMLDDLEL